MACVTASGAITRGAYRRIIQTSRSTVTPTQGQLIRLKTPRDDPPTRSIPCQALPGNELRRSTASEKAPSAAIWPVPCRWPASGRRGRSSRR